LSPPDGLDAVYANPKSMFIPIENIPEDAQKESITTISNWRLKGLVFISGAVLMGLEMAGSRVLAIHFGSSIYVWGSIIGIFLAALALTISKWKSARRWWRKGLLVIILLLSIVPAWFARQNHFEWMFNPLHHSSYVKTADAAFVRDTDMVLAVKINNEAVAYPVRLMAYHHVVSDTVGGTPICATY